MKKIICNNKMKIVFISFLICTLIFSYIYPYSVLAEDTTYSLKGAIEKIYDVTKSSYYDKLKEKVKEAVETKLGDEYQDGTGLFDGDGDGVKAFYYCYDSTDWITVTVTFKTLENAASSRVVNSCDVKISDEFNIETVRSRMGKCGKRK